MSLYTLQMQYSASEHPIHALFPFRDILTPRVRRVKVS